MVGIFAGAVIGFSVERSPSRLLPVIFAIAAAGVLNAGSNALNQIFDLENDRINKPNRPLPAGSISSAGAGIFTAVAYGVALVLAALVNAQTFAIYVVAALATAAYSAPPLRLKRRTWSSNLVIAVTRGELLKVAGWAAVATVLDSAEPWYIGFIYFLFLLGATTTKDFADVEGDRAAGCMTLPVRYGVERSAHLITPAFVLPWIVMALGVYFKILSGNAVAILAMSAVMFAWGIYVSVLMNRDPRRLATEGENHPAWRQMYWMMMAGHLGLAGAYALLFVR